LVPVDHVLGVEHLDGVQSGQELLDRLEHIKVPAHVPVGVEVAPLEDVLVLFALLLLLFRELAVQNGVLHDRVLLVHLGLLDFDLLLGFLHLSWF
jgi:hypothetical protein